MHELAIASALVDEAQKIAVQNRARRVSSVSVAIGVLSGVEREALCFSFPLVAEGTLLEGATLVVDIRPLRIKCSSCGVESECSEISFLCPSCADSKVELIGGREILITSMELEDDV